VASRIGSDLLMGVPEVLDERGPDLRCSLVGAKDGRMPAAPTKRASSGLVPSIRRLLSRGANTDRVGKGILDVGRAARPSHR
jgi:hypothetical protein